MFHPPSFQAPLSESDFPPLFQTKMSAEQSEAVNNNPRDCNVRKREDYLGWDDYFMGVARLSAQRSKDPNTQVGACIVSPEYKIVGIGYNGMPTGKGQICH